MLPVTSTKKSTKKSIVNNTLSSLPWFVEGDLLLIIVVGLLLFLCLWKFLDVQLWTNQMLEERGVRFAANDTPRLGGGAFRLAPQFLFSVASNNYAFNLRQPDGTLTDEITFNASLDLSQEAQPALLRWNPLQQHQEQWRFAPQITQLTFANADPYFESLGNQLWLGFRGQTESYGNFLIHPSFVLDPHSPEPPPPGTIPLPLPSSEAQPEVSLAQSRQATPLFRWLPTVRSVTRQFELEKALRSRSILRSRRQRQMALQNRREAANRPANTRFPTAPSSSDCPEQSVPIAFVLPTSGTSPEVPDNEVVGPIHARGWIPQSVQNSNGQLFWYANPTELTPDNDDGEQKEYFRNADYFRVIVYYDARTEQFELDFGGCYARRPMPRLTLRSGHTYTFSFERVASSAPEDRAISNLYLHVVFTNPPIINENDIRICDSPVSANSSSELRVFVAPQTSSGALRYVLTATEQLDESRMLRAGCIDIAGIPPFRFPISLTDPIRPSVEFRYFVVFQGRISEPNVGLCSLWSNPAQYGLHLFAAGTVVPDPINEPRRDTRSLPLLEIEANSIAIVDVTPEDRPRPIWVTTATGQSEVSGGTEIEMRYDENRLLIQIVFHVFDSAQEQWLLLWYGLNEQVAISYVPTYDAQNPIRTLTETWYAWVHIRPVDMSSCKAVN